MPSGSKIPSRAEFLLLGVIVFIVCTVGCRPTSESAAISALSQQYNHEASSIVPTTAATDLPATTPAVATAVLPDPSPTITPIPTSPACRETKGQIIRQQVASTHLNEPLEFRLYLPPCYSKEKSGGYPFLILLHGSVFKDDQWDRLGIDEMADRLITAGEIKPLIIFMPYEKQTLVNPYQAGFGTAITRDAIPWLETQYPLCPERICRAVGGISRGASWAVHIGFTDWKMFGSIGAHSLPPFWGDLNSLPLWLADIPQDERPRVFMDVGKSDPYREPAAQFEQFLTAYSIPHEWYLFNGGHDETYWGSHIEQYLRWYSAAWQDR